MKLNKSLMNKLLLTILSVLGLVGTISADIIPPNRRVSWITNGTVGIIGGIPAPYTTIVDVTQSPYNADKTGATSATSAIQSAINNNFNAIIYMPAGIYDIRTGGDLSGGGLSINRNNLILEGAGTNTILVGQIGVGDGGPVNSYGLTYNMPISNTIPMTVGTSNLVFVYPQDKYTSTVGPGDGFLITSTVQSTDLPGWEFMTSYANEVGATGGNWLQQFVTITGVSGNVYSFWPPLTWNFTNNPIAIPQSLIGVVQFQVRSNLGFANFTLTESNSPSMMGSTPFPIFNMSMVRNFYITNCNFLWAANHTLGMAQCDNGDIIGNNFSWSQLPPASNEGILLLQDDSGLIFENNILQGGAPAVEWNNGFNGNVFFGNFLTNNPGDFKSHSVHMVMNDFEQNVGSGFEIDGYFGSSSHHTLLRNRFNGTVALKRWTTYTSCVGNVLGNSSYYYEYMTTNSNYTSITGGYTIFELGYPNIGNETYDQLGGSVNRYNFPGWEWGPVTANGYYVETATQIGVNFITGDFENIPPSCADNNSCYQFVILGQDPVNTNYYWPVGEPYQCPNASSCSYPVSSSPAGVTLGVDGSITNGQRVFLSGTGAYQWLEYQETNTDILTGNTLATNSNSAITVTVWDNNGPQTITNSYVYGGAPSWWGTNHWPAIGPDVSPQIGLIPAQERFLGIPVAPTVVSVTLDYYTDIFKTGSPIGSTSFNVSRTGSTGSSLLVIFYLGGDGTALSSPDQNYNPCDAYEQLDFTASGCSQVPAPNVFQVRIPAGQSSVTISVQAVDSVTTCDSDTQSLPFILIPSSYTVDPNNSQVMVTVHADPNKWDPQ